MISGSRGLALCSYRQSDRTAAGFAVMFLIWVCAGLTVVLRGSSGRELLLLAALGLGIGGYALVEYKLRSRGLTAWTIFEGGVSATRDGVETFIPHSLDTRYRVLLSGSRTEYTEPELSLWMRSPATSEISIRSDSSGDAAYLHLKSTIGRTLLPQMRERLNEGATVDFEAIKVSAARLYLPGESVSWANVQAAASRGDRIKLELLNPPRLVQIPTKDISLLPVCLAFIAERVPLSGAARRDIWDGA